MSPGCNRLRKNAKAGGETGKLRSLKQTNSEGLDLSDDWKQQPKVYDRPWATDEITRDSSRRSE
jgi:hypothetical protein